ncbi:hypothetical protein [Leptospira kirschneri]|uniref:hypothetical protein n=1 Tax=Leptospira kirschneri TaxID=29507 RepID=UPI0009E216F4|nr:hypothetical protein [Leptospira kirschneri]
MNITTRFTDLRKRPPKSTGFYLLNEIERNLYPNFFTDRFRGSKRTLKLYNKSLSLFFGKRFYH